VLEIERNDAGTVVIDPLRTRCHHSASLRAADRMAKPHKDAGHSQRKKLAPYGPTRPFGTRCIPEEPDKGADPPRHMTQLCAPEIGSNTGNRYGY